MYIQSCSSERNGLKLMQLTTIRYIRAEVQPQSQQTWHALIKILATVLKSMAIVSNDELQKLTSDREDTSHT